MAPLEARRGAEAYLRHAAQTPSSYLLNDNSQLRGPWFDSLDWLAEVWVPQAVTLGLRYVAHVLPADRHADVLPSCLADSIGFKLQRRGCPALVSPVPGVSAARTLRTAGLTLGVQECGLRLVKLGE